MSNKQLSTAGPPASLETEQAILGACLLDPETAMPALIETGLTATDFYRGPHQRIFQAMRGTFEAGTPVDLITVSQALQQAGALEKIGGPAYLAELSDAVATAANVSHHAAIVREMAQRRRLIEVARDLEALATNKAEALPDLLDRAETYIMAIRGDRDRGGLKAVGDNIDAALERTDALASGQAAPGITIGFIDLDEKLVGGLEPGTLIIIGGRPGMGKTAFALNVALQIASPQERETGRQRPAYGVGFFSLEMSVEQLHHRLLAMLSGVDLKRIKTGVDLSKDDWSALTDAAATLKTAQLSIDDAAALTVLDIRARARRLASSMRQRGVELGLIVVDYLQLMSGRGETREQEISGISRGLKALAKELNCPVMALSQLNRDLEKRENKQPALSDLRESGAIEQDADVVAFVHRPWVYDKKADQGAAEILIRKNRQGPTADLDFIFTPETGRFRSAARQ